MDDVHCYHTHIYINVYILITNNTKPFAESTFMTTYLKVYVDFKVEQW